MKLGNDFIVHNFDKVVNNVRKLRGELNPIELLGQGSCLGHLQLCFR